MTENRSISMQLSVSTLKVKSNLEKITEREEKEPEKLKKQLDLMASKQAQSQKLNLNRYSEVAILACENMHPRAWRALSYIVNRLPMYPYEAVKTNEDGTLIERYMQGKTTFASKFRRCIISAEDYGKLHCPDRPGYAGKLLLNDLKYFRNDSISDSFGGLVSEDEERYVVGQVDADVPLFSRIEIYREATVSKITTDKNGRETTKKVQQDVLIKNTEKALQSATSVKRAAITISNEVAVVFMLQLQNFSLVGQVDICSMDPSSKKIFEIMFCIFDQNTYKAKFSKNKEVSATKNHNLQHWNNILNTKYNTLSKVKTRLEKVAGEINSYTEFSCFISYSEKIGRTYKSIMLTMVKKAAIVNQENIKSQIKISEPKNITKRPERPKLPRKPIKNASMEDIKQWAKKNVDILLEYSEKLSRTRYKLLKPDVIKLEECTRILNEN